jgi:hypothetical protein
MNPLQILKSYLLKLSYISPFQLSQTDKHSMRYSLYNYDKIDCDNVGSNSGRLCSYDEHRHVDWSINLKTAKQSSDSSGTNF